MRKIVAGLFISLDGVYEAPETWHFQYFNDEMGEAVGAQMAESDCMLLGRVTYEEFAAYWPQQTSDGEAGEMAGFMNDTPKYVVSSTLKSADWKNTTLLDGTNDGPEHARALAERAASFVKRSGVRPRITIVPYNSIGANDPFKRSLSEDAFRDELAKYGFFSHKRYSGGADVQAACGQLVAEHSFV